MAPISSDKRNTFFILGWGLHLILSVGYLMSSFFVASNANAGFNAVFTGLIFAAYGVGGLLITHPNTGSGPFTVGFLLGINVMVGLVALMTAIYWGELSQCEDFKGLQLVDHFSCNDSSAMQAVAAFSSLVFLLAIGKGMALFRFKEELTASTEVLSKSKARSDGDFEAATAPAY